MQNNALCLNTIDSLMFYIPLIRSKIDTDECLITLNVRMNEKLRIFFTNLLTQ